MPPPIMSVPVAAPVAPPPVGPPRKRGPTECDGYVMMDDCHKVQRVVPMPPAWPPWPLKFTGRDNYTVPPAPDVPPISVKIPTEPCEKTAEAQSRWHFRPAPWHVSGINMGFAKEGFDKLPEQCKRGFKVPANGTKPPVRYAVTFTTGDVVTPEIGYPVMPCAVCHTHAWQAPEMKLIIAVTTRGPIPDLPKGCLAYCKALGYAIVRVPWLEEVPYAEVVVDKYGCAPPGAIKDEAGLRALRYRMQFFLDSGSSWARWLVPMVVMSAVFGTPTHVLQEWAAKEPAKLAELADKLPPDAQYAWAVGTDTLVLDDYGAKVWDYVVDRADYGGSNLLPFFGSARQLDPRLFNHERGGYQFSHHQFRHVAHNSEVTIYNVPCMAMMYEAVLKESRANQYWTQYVPNYPADQVPIWAVNAASGIVSLGIELNYPGYAEKMCLNGPSPDREVQVFHFFGWKQWTMSDPRLRANTFLEPFYGAYCNSLIAAADGGFLPKNLNLFKICADYFAFPRPRECVKTPIVFKGDKWKAT